MKRALSKVPAYLGHVLLLFLLWPVAALLRRINPMYRNLWLLSERGFDARDNGYGFFRYLRTQHPEINTCFVIGPDSPDYKKVAALGRTVPMASLRHYLMYLCADYLIATHVQPAAPDIWKFYHLRQIGIRPRGKQVFLQHGIIGNNMLTMHYPKLQVDLFISGGKPEYDYLTSAYEFPEGIIRYTGLCRFDNLQKNNAPCREILVMPTWRGSDYPSGEHFTGTPYYRNFQALLNSPRLQGLLEKHDLKLIFYPHIELQKELGRFTSPSDRIVLAGWEHYDVQTLLMRCNLLITDYSSVFFDVGYMEKPVIYFQFDLEDFRKYHYQEGYFSYENHGFGPVVKTVEEVLYALEESIDRGFRIEPLYQERLDAFFPMRDEKNCERTFEIVSSLRENKQAGRI
ncbi:MAG: CDP-glycerol glycerophosphotransferase family protein [Clostridia bacterium]|nr:CDP-glycerol glycerophosphotransferase family protein [Clostridia bacterium]